MPGDIITHEQALRILASDLEHLKQPGLDTLELQRLRILVDAVQTYDSVLEKLEGWVEIEIDLLRWIRKSLSSKRPETYRPDQRNHKLLILESRLSENWRQAEERRMKLSGGPVTFFEQVVGFRPTEYRKHLAKKFAENQFVAMRWSRQSGKSWISSSGLLFKTVGCSSSEQDVLGFLTGTLVITDKMSREPRILCACAHIMASARKIN